MVAVRSTPFRPVAPSGLPKGPICRLPKPAAPGAPASGAGDGFERTQTRAPTAPPQAPSDKPRDVYTVRPGDTLSAIGDRYGVPYQDIARHNGISNPNLIYPGQRIQIPGAGTPAGGPATPSGTTGATGAAPASPTSPNARMQAALDWSAAQMNPETATGVNSNNGLSRQQDPKAWNNWCLAFVSTAYGREVPELRAGSAIESYNKFADAGKVRRTADNIPAGAPVFFGTTPNNQWGHIAIATGRTDANGQPIIRTSGWNGRDGIFELPLSAFSGAYLGYGVIGA